MTGQTVCEDRTKATASSPVTNSPPEARRSLGRLLITAGPTHEPIDAVRYIANRSSGRVGIALAEHAAARGWDVTLLLGPTPRAPSSTNLRLIRFQTTADLDRLLAEHHPTSDVLIMAAAVADYRPKLTTADDGSPTKIKRAKTNLTLELEPTPDLLAGCASRRKPGQLLVGFALEPRERLMESARDKLTRKKLDLIVANPLETMDSEGIEATVLSAHGKPAATTAGVITKEAFADWLLAQIEAARQRS